MKIETKKQYNITEYIFAVEDIANGFFDSEGKYKPHFGMVNAMQVFWNTYVIESDIEMPHNLTEIEDLDKVITNEDFIKEYGNELDAFKYKPFTFAAAYHEAQKIVAHRRTTIGYISETVGDILKTIKDKFEGLFTDENVAAITQIINEISDGKLSSDSLVDSYLDKKYGEE